MKKEPMHCLGMISWLVTAIVSIHVGLLYFGYNFFSLDMLLGMPMLISALMLLVLASGVLSLVMYVMSLMGKSDCGGSC